MDFQGVQYNVVRGGGYRVFSLRIGKLDPTVYTRTGNECYRPTTKIVTFPYNSTRSNPEKK